ncbi:MAG TPA: phytanoyl-CoA dioxygenase family protein [Sphingobium sp.]|uniref:phytanoyl-CoA dioxygenase family protein n=1 Tax=Sphingobium sp. TaxID=1912891 RepID=UPI002ED1A9AE
MPLDAPITGPLSDADVAQFATRGWIACRGLFTPAEAAEIARWTDELVALPEEPGRHMVYYEDSLTEPGQRVMQRIEDFCPYHPQFDTLVRAGTLLSAIEQLLGERALLFKEKINFKRPGGAGFEAHQDQQAGWSTYAPLFITALVGLDEATLDNGCLEMTDTPRETALIGTEWQPLTAEQMAGFSLTPLPTAPGDVLFFDSYAPHASKPNFTAHQRRILYLTYNATQHGDQRRRYYDDKRASFPPDIERAPGQRYTFRV